MRLLFILIVSLCLLQACDKFEYNQYQVTPREGDHDINSRNIQRLPSLAKDSFKVAVIGDSQRFYSSTLKVVKNINTRDDIDFVIHTGDLVDFGLQREFTGMHQLLSTLDIPYITVIGNHDLIANGGDIYKAMYGPYDFSFFYQGYKFIFLNTNGLEFGFDHTVPNLNWMEHQLKDSASYTNAFVINHVPPGHVDFDSDLEAGYRNIIGKYGKVLLSINGHNHDFAYTEVTSEEVSYLNTYSTSKERYIILTIWKNGYKLEHIDAQYN